MNDFIDVRQLVTLLLKRWWVIVLAVAISGALGYGVSRNIEPVYEATSTLLVGQSLRATNLSSGDIQIGQHLAVTYAAVGRRQPVLEGTVDALGLDVTWQQLRNRVHIEPVEGTQLLEISVEAPSRAEARSIADEIAQQMILLSPSNATSPDEAEAQLFVGERLDSLRLRIENAQSRIEELEGEVSRFDTAADMRTRQNEIDSLEQLITNWESNYAQLLTLREGDNTVNHLALVEPAEARPEPVRPRIWLNTILSGILGLGLALGGILLKEYTDDSIKSTEDLERAIGLTALGEISRIRGEGYSGKLINALGPFSPTSEALNVVRSNIGFLSGGRLPGVILVTSAGIGEGKSLIAANLGLSMARSGIETVIVDADLRRPAQYAIFGAPNAKGVTNLLTSSDAELSEYLRDTGAKSLKLIPSGKPPTNPAELLDSERLELLLHELMDTFEVVIVDGPPILTAADAALLSNKVDAVVMVVQSGRTTRQEARKAVSILRQADASVLGAVLNRAAPKGHNYRYAPYEDSEPGGDSLTRYVSWLRPSNFRKTQMPKAGTRVTANGRGEPESISDGDA